MAATLRQEDRPKIIGLVVAIVAVFAFMAFRFLGSKPVEAPNQTVAANLPSTNSIASGEALSPNKDSKVIAENLHEVFASSLSVPPGGSPFRMPVPQVKQVVQNTAPTTRNDIGGPTQREPRNEFSLDGQFQPVKPGGIGNDPTGNQGPQVDFGGVRVKGIIAPQNGGQALAFIQVGDRGKGFRIGDEIAPGMKLVGITSTVVSVKIGGTIANFGVGQEVRPG